MALRSPQVPSRSFLFLSIRSRPVSNRTVARNLTGARTDELSKDRGVRTEGPVPPQTTRLARSSLKSTSSHADLSAPGHPVTLPGSIPIPPCGSRLWASGRRTKKRWPGLMSCCCEWLGRRESIQFGVAVGGPELDDLAHEAAIYVLMH